MQITAASILMSVTEQIPIRLFAHCNLRGWMGQRERPLSCYKGLDPVHESSTLGPSLVPSPHLLTPSHELQVLITWEFLSDIKTSL